jgi:hypothetical protein
MKETALRVIGFLKEGRELEAQKELQLFFGKFKDNSGTIVAIGLGKLLSKSDLHLEQILPLVQHFWDKGNFLEKVFAVSLLAKRTREKSLVPVLYRLAISSGQEAEVERLALSFAVKFFKENPEMAELLEEWRNEKAPMLSKMANFIKERLG